jgi:hypothetical protein
MHIAGNGKKSPCLVVTRRGDYLFSIELIVLKEKTAKSSLKSEKGKRFNLAIFVLNPKSRKAISETSSEKENDLLLLYKIS